jgi:hypothetical protein
MVPVETRRLFQTIAEPVLVASPRLESVLVRASSTELGEVP